LPETDLTARLADLTAAAGELAHEIRNPLSTLRVNLDLLAESLREASPQEFPDTDLRRRSLHKVEILHNEAKRLQRILDDFLRFVGGGAPNAVPTDVNDVVGSAIDFFAPQALARGITTRSSLSDEPLVCKLDDAQLRQALLNLMINAQEAMEDGGELIVQTARTDKSKARIDVIDTGPGIPEDRLANVFAAYYSTKKQGTGLGLPTAKRIVEDLGGALTVASVLGQGTNFTITLPLCAPADAEAAP
jgi:signal transduction histidine kinase